jgi:hypothetical protein
VDDGWFVVREKCCWLVAGGWFVLREKYRWLVADKPSEQGVKPPISKEKLIYQVFFNIYFKCIVENITNPFHKIV